MDLYNDFVGLLGDYLIRGIFISVLVVWIATLFKRIDVHYSKSILKWIMIGYACLLMGYYALLFAESWYDGVAFSGFGLEEEASVQYWLFFWFMMLANTLFPFILLVKKIGGKIIFLLLMAVSMNFGWLFEWFVVVVTTFHRDYVPGGWNFKVSLFPYNARTYLVSGLILGIVVVLIGNVISSYKRKKKVL